MSQEKFKSQILERFKNKKATVGIIGMGYVGLPLGLRLTECGFKVWGVDINAVHVQKLNAGESYISHIPAERIAAAGKKGLKATTDFQVVSECDAIIVCVPTPLTKHREPDISYILNSFASIAPFLKKGQVLSLESTTYPGTTDEELLPRLKNLGFNVGSDYFLVFSPEREDPGNEKFQLEDIPKVVGGVTPACLEVGAALYGNIVHKVVQVSSTRAAELTKLLENIHRAVNIGLVNEMKIVCDKMGIDIFEVIKAAATKPFGFVPYYPGPGLGGHCIPIDPFYLTWKAREYGVHTKFIELAGEINTSMPHWVVHKLADAMNERGMTIRDSRILILGIAYKKNINDMRESPSVELMEILKAKGALIDYSDTFVPVFPKMREHFFELSSVRCSSENIKKFDCVVVATNHDDFDYAMVQRDAKLVIDTRGVYPDKYPNVVKA